MCKGAYRFVLRALLVTSVTADVAESVVKMSLRAMQLVEALQDENITDLSDARLFVDGSEAALLVKEDGYCYAIFDTTETFSLADWAKNIDPATEKVCAVPHNQDCCTARRGYHQAYTSPDYRAPLDVAIMMCYEEGYEVVLAGHSAGGAIATIAAVSLSEIDMTVLSFGQPASLLGKCSLIHEDQYYHWINTEVNKGWLGGDDENLDYDPVPNLSLTAGTEHFGRILIMGDDKDNVVLYQNNTVPSMTTWGFDAMAHKSSRYIERLESYLGRGDLATNGWSEGFPCNQNTECLSGKCEITQGGASYWQSGKCQDSSSPGSSLDGR
jgi:hypothetical protein